MPSTLICRCTPIHSKSRQKVPKSGVDGDAGGARLLPVAHGPVELPLLVPLDVRVAQERHEIVGHGAVHRVLEVEHAGIGLAHHEVARVVVAVHEHARLREVVREHAREHALERGALRVVERAPEVARDVPVGEEIELAPQERFVVRRQLAFARGALEARQRVERVEYSACALPASRRAR